MTRVVFSFPASFALGRLLLAGAAAGCVPEIETDLSQITAPRLLAIASSPAETQSGKEVTLSALVAVPEGAEVPRLDWAMCLSRKPLTELGPVSPLCLQPDDGSGAVLALGRGASVTATLDQDVCRLFGPLQPTSETGEPEGRPVDPDITGGFYQPFTARLGRVPSLGAVRIDCDPVNVSREQSIAYRNRYRSNENPVVSELSRRGPSGFEALEPDDTADPTRVSAGERLLLRASWNDCPTQSTCGDGLCTAFEDRTSCAEDCAEAPRGCTGAEPYVWYDRETSRVEPRREGISVAWYASRGRFEHEQTGLDEEQAASSSFTENTWIAGDQPGPATLWLVIRDTRGGQSWRTQRFEVTP